MQLKEILDRIEVPAFDDIPDRDGNGADVGEEMAAARTRKSISF